MGVFGADFEASGSPVAPAALKLAARKAVNDAARRSHTARELAASAREAMERALGLGWHVVVGSDFSVELRYRKGACVLLASKGTSLKVLLFRTTPAVAPAPTSEHAALAGASSSGGARKVTVYECDMADELRAGVVDRVQRLIGALDGESDPQTAMAKALKHSLTREFGHTWQVVVAAPRDFCCLPHADTGSYADFAVGKLRVVVYQHAGASLDRRLDMAQFGKRSALVLATMCVVVFAFFFFTAPDADAGAAAAERNALGRKAAMIGMTVCTVLASVIRTYANAIRPKYKQV